MVSYTAAISACVSDWSKSLVLLQKLLSENLGFEKNRTWWIFGGFKFFSLHMCNLQLFLSNIYLIHIYSCVLDLCYLQSYLDVLRMQNQASLAGASKLECLPNIAMFWGPWNDA